MEAVRLKLRIGVSALDKNEIAALLESLCDRPFGGEDRRFGDDADGRSLDMQDIARRTRLSYRAPTDSDPARLRRKPRIPTGTPSSLRRSCPAPPPMRSVTRSRWLR